MPRPRIAEPVQLRYGLSDVEKALRVSLEKDLSFKGHGTSHANHNTHAFAAKFPPQLPRAFIEELTDPGERVLDPMAGSGTALVEAALAGRVGIGADIDPLAVWIIQTKTTRLEPERVLALAENVADYARLVLAQQGPDCAQEVLGSFSDASRSFIEYWFQPSTIAELGALRRAIAQLIQPPYRRPFEVLFSSIIVTKSGGVSLARDLAHSRPHKVDGKRIKSAVDAFADKAVRFGKALNDVRAAQGQAYVIRADAKRLPLPGEAVDLIVTSPPYANAIDYVRAHKFSLVWLGYDIPVLTDLRRRYIGAELRPETSQQIESETGRRVLRDIRERDAHRAEIISRYFQEMTETLSEMYRVLRAGRAAVVVVGSSTARSIVVPTALILAEIGERLGFKLVGVKEREIDRDRRLMPISNISKGTGIEARMHREHVIAFLKPA